MIYIIPNVNGHCQISSIVAFGIKVVMFSYDCL